MTLSGIIAGFGLMKTTFFYNMFTAIIRILFLIFLVPSYGIMGYLWGVLVSELCGTILNVRKVKKNMPSILLRSGVYI